MYTQAVVLSNNDSVAIIGGKYEGYFPNITDPIRAQVYSFSQNAWTSLPGLEGSGAVPPHRQEHTAVKSANGLIYIHGGVSSFNNFTLIMDNWSYDPTAGIFTNLATPPVALYGSTATALPDGRILYVGGWYSDPQFDPGFSDYFLFNQSAVYNPEGDSWQIQELNADAIGNPEVARVHSNAVLGPEGRYLYYFGGDNLGITGVDDEYYNDLWMLDTQTWTWTKPSVAGIQPRARTGGSGALLSSKYLIFGLGGAQTFRFNTFDILAAAKVSNPETNEVDFSSAKWIANTTTGEILNQAQWSPNGISGGIIAAVVIVCVVVVLMLLYLAFRFRHRVRRAIMRVHYGIWSPRTGEPLWAETARLISKVILMFLFIAFFVFVIVQVIESPKSTYIVTEVPEDGQVTIPDARICFEGFSIQESPEDGSVYPRVSCMTDTGLSCNDHITLLDLEYYNPHFMGNLGNNRCFLFTGNNIGDNQNVLKLAPETIPQLNSGHDFQLSFRTVNISESGRVHVSFYPAERDPNRVIFLSDTSPKLSDSDISAFIANDNDDYSSVNTVDLKPFDYAYVQYQLESKEYLTDNGWNYVGFAPNHNKTPEVSITQRVQNQPDMADTMVARMIIAPATYTTLIHREQKIYSLVNGVGFIGGLFGLFVAFQAIMFGFRPRSPFGLVHRWSVGEMRRSISSGLKDRFNVNKTPVPLVNPVHDRYSLDMRNYGRSYVDDEEATYIDDTESLSSEHRMTAAAGTLSPIAAKGTPSTSQIFVNDDSRRLAQVEDRMQLLELVFKSYYVDDEVFQRLDVALKRPEDQANRASRRSIGNYFRNSRSDQAGPRSTADHVELPMREQEQTVQHPAAVPVPQQHFRNSSDSD
ncbi:hypothetical protein INT45_013555 [Circinella minor]|uniref:Galactose oxidase n=1 Tax=Circinella minor TaxID=1195481 RepID=A0A8H7VQ48_9FUNG|nr:hypothetical protein INT45_013555 [Circinella minor]